MSAVFIDVGFVRAQVERLKLDFPEIADDAELYADMLEGSTDLHEILTRLVREERDAASFAEAVKAQEDDLCSRRHRFVTKQEALRSFMQSLLETAQQQKIVLPEATLSLATRGPRPVVNNEAVIPDALCKFKRSPDMAAIKTELDAGRAVPGVHLSNGATSISIRVK